MNTYKFKPKSRKEVEIPYNVRTNALANANIVGLIIYTICFLIAVLVEYNTYYVVILEIMNFPVAKAKIVSLLIVLFSKLLVIVLYKPFRNWLKDSSKLFYKTVIRCVAISVLVNVIIFGILFSYHLIYEQAVNGELRVKSNIQSNQLLLSEAEGDSNLTKSIESDIQALENTKQRYSYRIISIEDNGFIRFLKILFNVLLSINAVCISAIIYLWAYFYYLSLMYKYKINRVKKKLERIRATFHTRLHHLNISNSKVEELENEIQHLITKSK